MKNLLTFIFFLLLTNLNAQIINFEDPVFKTVLTSVICADIDGDGVLDSSADLNSNGEIEMSEAETVIGLNVSDRSISSLDGLQFFLNIQNLNASENLISEIDLTQNAALESLVLNNNGLSTIDLSQNLNLKNVYIENNSLGNIDLTNNVQINHLTLKHNNLIEIDLSQNVNLITLQLSGNQLNGIDLSNNLNLSALVLNNCSLNSIDLTSLTSLQSIDIDRNNMSSIDLSNNTQLYFVFASRCDNLLELDLSNSLNLIRVQCLYNDQLSSLNIQNGFNENLEQIWAFENPNLNCIQVDNVSYSESQDCMPSNITGWCVDEWTKYSENCLLNINDFKASKISLFPNPTSDILQIVSEYPIESIVIYNSLGKKMGIYDQLKLDISHFQSGLYFITLKSDTNFTTKKFVKK